MKKICVKCNISQSIENFYKQKAAKDGFNPYCKSCVRESSRKYVESNRQKNRQESVIEIVNKKCHSCKVEKKCSEFSKDKTKHDNLASYCKECNSNVSRRFRALNEGYAKNYNAQYYSDNKEEVKKANRRYVENNREKVRVARRKRESYLLKHDLNYKLRRYMRDNLLKGIKKGSLSKDCSTIQILGCSIEQLKLHLESQFTEGMSWENYGQWHIDHIKPCAAFDLTVTEQVNQCYHYSNLQPLWAKDNIKKNSNYKGQKHYYKR